MLEKEKEQAQWDTWLVEAVRKIRMQKQRPGLDRIYNAVRLIAEKEHQAEQSQRSPIAPIYNMQFNQIQVVQVQRHLDRAVKSGLLLKVISKGQTTYKTPEKCERQLNLIQCSPEDLSKCVIKVVKELSETDPTANPGSSSTTRKVNTTGFSLQTISEYIRHSHVIAFPPEETQPDDFLLGKVEEALTREVKRNKLDFVDDLYKIHVHTPKGGLMPAYLLNPDLFSTPGALQKTCKERSSGSISGGSGSGGSSGGSPKAILEVETDEFRALVKEQTARAVKLVMKDRLSESPPGSSSAGNSSATSSRKSSKDSKRSSKSTTPERLEGNTSTQPTSTSSMLKELTQLTRVINNVSEIQNSSNPSNSPGRNSPGALSVTTIITGGGPDGTEEVTQQILGSSVSASALDLLEKVKDVAAACTASNSSVTLTLTCTMSREDALGACPTSPAGSSTTSTSSSSSSISSTKTGASSSGSGKETAVIKLMVPSFRVGSKPSVIANPGGNSTHRKIIGGGGVLVSSGSCNSASGVSSSASGGSSSSSSSGIKKSGNKSPKASSTTTSSSSTVIPKSQIPSGGHSPKQGANNNAGGNNSPKYPGGGEMKTNPGSKSPPTGSPPHQNPNVIKDNNTTGTKPAGPLSLAIPLDHQKGPMSISDIASAIVYEVSNIYTYHIQLFLTFPSHTCKLYQWL